MSAASEERGALSLENGNAQYARVRKLGFGLAVEKETESGGREDYVLFVCFLN